MAFPDRPHVPSRQEIKRFISTHRKDLILLSTALTFLWPQYTAKAETANQRRSSTVVSEIDSEGLRDFLMQQIPPDLAHRCRIDIRPGGLLFRNREAGVPKEVRVDVEGEEICKQVPWVITVYLENEPGTILAMGQGSELREDVTVHESGPYSMCARVTVAADTGEVISIEECDTGWVYGRAVGDAIDKAKEAGRDAAAILRGAIQTLQDDAEVVIDAILRGLEELRRRGNR